MIVEISVARCDSPGCDTEHRLASPHWHYRELREAGWKVPDVTLGVRIPILCPSCAQPDPTLFDLEETHAPTN